jgi:hypothetical protein
MSDVDSEFDRSYGTSENTIRVSLDQNRIRLFVLEHSLYADDRSSCFLSMRTGPNVEIVGYPWVP